jgi:hypothetical protein
MNNKINIKLTREHFIDFEMDFTSKLNVKINKNYYEINEELYWNLYLELSNDLFNI